MKLTGEEKRLVWAGQPIKVMERLRGRYPLREVQAAIRAAQKERRTIQASNAALNRWAGKVGSAKDEKGANNARK